MKEEVPSGTATVIARGTVLASMDPALGQLVAPGEAEAARQMLGERATRGWFSYVLRHRAFRQCLMRGEEVVLGGIIAHYLVRKRWIERETRRALAEGIRQIVVVGAGFDSLAWRLHREFPKVRFFELDHPATQKPKRAALDVGENLRFLSVDLSFTLPHEVLGTCAEFAGNEPAFVVAEGLTMYFEEEKVCDILCSMADVAGSGGHVLFTFMEQRADGSIHFRGEHPAVGWWLRLCREPFRWGCTRESVLEFATNCGMRVQTVAGEEELRSEILTPRGLAHLGLAQGECLCLCAIRPDI